MMPPAKFVIKSCNANDTPTPADANNTVIDDNSIPRFPAMIIINNIYNPNFTMESTNVAIPASVSFT